MLGGLGSQLGVVIAAIVLIGGPELVRELEDFRMLAFGGLMVLIMIWRPRGLLAFREPTIRLRPRRDAGAPPREGAQAADERRRGSTARRIRRWHC